jgi:hypothetical protein
MDNQTVAVNEFVRRQIKGSGKSYSVKYSFEDIAEHALEQLNAGRYTDGYRDGVVIVQADPNFARHFVCPLVRISENIDLSAKYIARREGEEPVIQIRAAEGDPLPAGSLELILYRNDVLKENDEQSSDSDWELIAFHAIPQGIAELPMHPVTMMRNQLCLSGGTEAEYSSKEWAEAVHFWQKYAALEI